MSMDYALEELRAANLLTSAPRRQAGRFSGITADSRKASRGCLFVAIRGTRQSGAAFAKEAAARGAVAIVADGPVKAPFRTVRIRVRNSAKALGVLSAAFFRHPTERLKVYGVTGTNGKTTTAGLIRHILAGLGSKTALIGTVHRHIPGRKAEESALTTPDSLDLNRFFRQALDAGCEAGVCEVSSHSLDQDRVWGVRFRAAVFTNLTQDHLDYHKTMEGYFKAKTKLFSEYEYGNAIVNIDDPYGRRLAGMLAAEGRAPVTYGTRPDARVRILPGESSLKGSRFRLRLFRETIPFRINLLGDYNIANAAAAVAACATPENMHEIPRILATAEAPPGRMERVDAGQPFVVLVDYAHTPDALEKLLKSCRRLRPRRLISVFGCGGDRDKTKRPKMAKVTTAWSHLTIVTSDNPRTENPLDIIRDIRPGLTGREGRDYRIEPDRRRAIAMACRLAGPQDLVVIAGKGHETYQIIGTTKYPFDDRKTARRALSARPGGNGEC